MKQTIVHKQIKCRHTALRWGKKPNIYYTLLVLRRKNRKSVPDFVNILPAAGTGMLPANKIGNKYILLIKKTIMPTIPINSGF